MPFTRVIKHYQNDSTTFVQNLDTRSTLLWFELLRQGGCGPGEVRLKDVWSLRDQIEIGDWISAEYSNGDRWYLGRVESITSDDPAGATLSLYGMVSQLSEVFPGGFGATGDNMPHMMAKSDWFIHDPDRALHSWDVIDQPEDVVGNVWQNYINPATNITLHAIESPSPQVGLDSLIFRGEESAMSIIRSMAIMCKGASWGVDELGRLFFLQKRAQVIGTFQEGVDLLSLKRTKDRSLLYNRLLLTGGYVYGLNILSDVGEIWTGFYRYRASFHVQSSINSHGERRMRIFVPWVRRNADGIQFAREFFRTYAKPTERFTFTTRGQNTLIRPWQGRVRLKDQAGATLALCHIDQVRVEFDHAPKFTVTIGPEDVTYPDGPEQPDRRFEVQPAADLGDGEDRPDISITSLGTFTGISSSIGS